MRGEVFAAAGIFLAATGAASADTITVEIAKLAFVPAQVTAHVGDTIVWKNEDFITHTATARNHEWDVTIPAHATGRAVLSKPEVIDYFCRIHPNMRGRITVEEK